MTDTDPFGTPDNAPAAIPDTDDLDPVATPSPQREIEDALGTARAVLFDLDGTLADTAPDLAAAVNRMLVGRGLPLVPYETLRPVASAGARGLLGAGFGITPEHPDYPALREEFLANYASDLCVETILFPGIDALLAELESRGVRWGIVTNKVESLARPLVEQLGLGTRAACIVGGDTTPFSKPHPAPLLHAAQLLQLPPAQCLYVGDDLRDIQAGRAAGMLTIAAGFGYCGETAPASWGADALVETTDELIALLRELT